MPQPRVAWSTQARVKRAGELVGDAGPSLTQQPARGVRPWQPPPGSAASAVPSAMPHCGTAQACTCCERRASLRHRPGVHMLRAPRLTATPHKRRRAACRRRSTALTVSAAFTAAPPRRAHTVQPSGLGRGWRRPAVPAMCRPLQGCCAAGGRGELEVGVQGSLSAWAACIV
jgi:hypothetical protein